MKEGKLNNILKIATIFALLLISFSVFYYHIIIPSKEKKQQKLNYEIRFRDECNNRFAGLKLKLEGEKGKDPILFEAIKMATEKYCKEAINTFEIESLFVCSDGSFYILEDRKEYVSRCLDYKMREINL